MASDAERLIADAKAGDPATLGRLLEPYRHYLRLLARLEIGRRLQGKVDASDVVQECFLDAHRYFPSFRGAAEAQFVQWLREILAGTLANQVRRYLGTQARDVRLEVGLAADLDQSSQALAGVAVDPHSSPSQQAARGEQAVLVAEALGRRCRTTTGRRRAAAPGRADVPASGRADGAERGQRGEAVAARARPPAARPGGRPVTHPPTT